MRALRAAGRYREAGKLLGYGNRRVSERADLAAEPIKDQDAEPAVAKRQLTWFRGLPGKPLPMSGKSMPGFDVLARICLNATAAAV